MKSFRSIKNIYKLLFVIIIIDSHSTYSKNFKKFGDYEITKTKFVLEKISNGFNYPWGLTFIDKNHLLITEKNGKLYKVNIVSGKKEIINHSIASIPYKSKSLFSQQGGLLDVLYHDGFIYFSYSHNFYNSRNDRKFSKNSSTAIARGKLIGNEIKNLQILLIAQPKLKPNKHWGSRIIIKDDYLYASFGERDQGMISQDGTKHPGSIVRIFTDGGTPNDNPKFKNRPNWLPEIYLIGVRNPQGMAISPNDGEIYFSQHGPRGGDNISKVKYGVNFGWKDIAWGGTEYNGSKIGDVPFKDKYEKYIASWVPSMGIGNFQFYNGETFPEWKGDIILTSTAAETLFRLDFNNNKITNEEIILEGKIGRIRDLEINQKGDIYLIVDEENSSLWKISK